MDTGTLIKEQYGGDIAAFVRGMHDKARTAAVEKSLKRTREYYRWIQMMRRCYDDTHHAYHRYGGRGISVHLAWQEFETFFKEVGSPPGEGLSMDRIDNDGDYAPGNIRWATPAQQNANKPIPAPKISITKTGATWTARISVIRRKTFAKKSDAAKWLADLQKKICEPTGEQ